MFEFIALIGLVMLFGVVALAVGVVLLPFYLLFRLLGFAIQVGFASIFLLFSGLLLVPLFLILGVMLVPALLVLAIPILIAAAIFSWIIGFFRHDPAAPIVAQRVS